MNLERFQALADAFGGSVARWPADEQDAAWAALTRLGAEADAILAAARDLDATLDGGERLQPSAALRRRVLDAAPRPRAPRPPLLRWLTGAGVGVGLAAAGAAGVAVGVGAAISSAGEDAVLLATAYSADLIDAGGAS